MAALAGLRFSSRLLCPTPVRVTVRPFQGVARPVHAVSRQAVVHVVAADEKVQKKKLPSPVKRAQLAKERRMYNRSRKSACSTRIKKVLKMAEALKQSPPKSEEEVKPLEVLIREAYEEIDKAHIKGILHKNTAARKKARCAKHKREVLIVAGLYTPTAEQPGYTFAQQLKRDSAPAKAAA